MKADPRRFDPILSPPKKRRKKRAKPPKCECGHLAKNHETKGKRGCLMSRSTPGGHVYRCDCEELRVRSPGSVARMIDTGDSEDFDGAGF